ncbi:hypothetical protein COMA2_210005 [Candidatus Nitrospira nitrificans]|uniref:Uncharacterized protein n=1 Tax=Candidatus Nitrospira nitrificans TaxID=1742973 RepID=A0A0S4LF02_9BACT|nr:hypothetical protein COMA2_210005 [Candidatus Nitrospira nitrificans]
MDTNYILDEIRGIAKAKVEGRTITLNPKHLIDQELKLASMKLNGAASRGPFPPLRQPHVPSAAPRHDRFFYTPFSEAVSKTLERTVSQIRETVGLLAFQPSPPFSASHEVR